MITRNRQARAALTRSPVGTSSVTSAGGVLRRRFALGGGFSEVTRRRYRSTRTYGSRYVLLASLDWADCRLVACEAGVRDESVSLQGRTGPNVISRSPSVRARLCPGPYAVRFCDTGEIGTAHDLSCVDGARRRCRRYRPCLVALQHVRVGPDRGPGRRAR